MTDDDPYAEDYAAIDGDLEHAVTLGFAEYVGYMAHYGARLRELAAAHPAPESAYLHLRDYADRVVERLADR
jgi:hypothetical protein